MFGEALLESAPTLRRRKRWPIATAFTLELIVAGVLVVLPLMSTGVIPLKATVIVPTPPRYVHLENQQPVHQAGNNHGVSAPTTRVLPVSNSNHILYRIPSVTSDLTDGPPPNIPVGDGEKNGNGSDLVPIGQPVVVPQPKRPLVVSRTTEAMLMNKVVPEYPLIAKISGIQGDVKLHALVDRNGNIQSLTVLGTPPPVLAKAALDAVQQWKYRPYFLNGEPVEIETFITVTFKRN